MMKIPNNFRAEPFAYHEEIELRIADLTNLGSGVGRVNGWVVFVPYALPGELVRARIWRNKKQYSDADLVEILEASPDRMEPGCPLFGECGGCQYQHYAYKAQLHWKQEQIKQLFKKMIGVEFEVRPTIGSEQIYHYRSKITPHFRRPPHIEGTAIGFERAASRSIIDVKQCPIASEAINERLTKERKLLQSGAKAFKRGGTLLLRDGEGGVVTDMREVTYEVVNGYRFGFVAGEFFQTNPHVLPLMIDHSLEMASGDAIEFLVDAYCGVGVFGICAIKKFQEIVGIEINEKSYKWAQENLENNGIQNMKVLLGSADAIFKDLTFDAPKTTILMDPPRRGSDELFLGQLVDFGPAKVVYVSCGPDTQARDITFLLERGYEVESIQPFDLFPHTRHIENVVTLKKI